MLVLLSWSRDHNLRISDHHDSPLVLSTSQDTLSPSWHSLFTAHENHSLKRALKRLWWSTRSGMCMSFQNGHNRGSKRQNWGKWQFCQWFKPQIREQFSHVQRVERAIVCPLVPAATHALVMAIYSSHVIFENEDGHYIQKTIYYSAFTSWWEFSQLKFQVYAELMHLVHFIVTMDSVLVWFAL